MSTRRVGLSAWEWDKVHGIEYGPRGYRLCRLCKTECPTKRNTFCGNSECDRRWGMLTSPSYVRMSVYQRDHGVCALCGLDTDGLREHIGAVLQRGLRPWGKRYALMGGRVSLWDADHIVPVVEGGGECDLDNYRTLCLWCHKKVTAELARRRADERNRARFEAARQKATSDRAIAERDDSGQLRLAL